MAEITVRDLMEKITTTPQKIMFDLLLLSNGPMEYYDKFVALVETTIDWKAQEMARNPEFRQNRTEDELTHEVVSSLRTVGFDATQETRVGGHCDIVVEGKFECLWLAEAKIYSSYAWLYKGFLQFATRYSTGAVNQDRGSIIIYCRVQRINEIMERWGVCLSERVDGISVATCEKNPLALRSSHSHARTGRSFNIRHVPISLYFDPKH